jgi:predicted Zn-dependent protease
MQFVMIKYVKIITLMLILTIVNAQAQDFSYDSKMGAEAALQVEQMIGLYPDSALNDYVQQIGGRLVNALGPAPFEFRFHVVDMTEPNAFALPGGYIYVSRGLLSLVNDEAELAGVIGHEMIHVTKRHSVKQMRKGILPGLLHIPGAIVGIFNSELGNIINAPVSLGTELFMSNYSRKQESESDKYGVKLASSAGYDPHKLAVMLENLSKDVENLTGEEEKRSYFSSHPFTPKRVENIEKEINQLDWTEAESIASDKPVLYSKLDGMVYGQNPAQGIIEDNLFKHPDLDMAIQFPEKWNTMNVPVALAAIEPDGKAQLFITPDNSGAKPDSIGKAVADKLMKEYDLKPTRNGAININGFDAYELVVIDGSGKQPVEVQLYWVQMGDYQLNMMGMCMLNYSDMVANAMKSLRPLTEEEKQNFTGIKLRVVAAEEGETLEALSKRTNNIWDLKTTILKNGLEENPTLEKGQVLKIAVEEPYFLN